MSPFLLVVGEPLVALVPPFPGHLDDADELRVYTGGAELNTAVGVSRLGVASGWLGRIGNDPLGRRVLRALDAEGVNTSLAVVDPVASTGLYLREWLPDGVRRPYYYRRDGAGSRIVAADWPVPWPATTQVPQVLHVTGITAALSPGAPGTLHTMIDHARGLGSLISIDPNYRRALWSSERNARDTLRNLVHRADLVLLSEDDAHLMFGDTEPDHVLSMLNQRETRCVVYKRGARGAVACSADERVEVAAEPTSAAIDPVGAGDGFNAGFLAALLLGADLDDAVRCGAWCGARAVETLGEYAGYPRRAELPDPLREALEQGHLAASGGVLHPISERPNHG